MQTNIVSYSYTNSKVISALTLLFSLSACGQGFKVRQSQELSTESTKIQNFSVQRPAAASAATSKVTPPVAANDNEPLKFRFLTLDPGTEGKILDRYKHVDTKREINAKLLKDALLFFYVNQKNFMNNKVITVIDYSLPSSEKRLYVIELSSGRVWSTYVAHGRGSDKNHDGLPENFSDTLNSNATSIGAFLTMSPYKGNNGLSLRLKGLSRYNSNALERNVVIHGAPYVRDSSVKQGRSWGCPAVPPKYLAKLISTLKNGSLVYAGASKPSSHRQL